MAHALASAAMHRPSSLRLVRIHRRRPLPLFLWSLRLLGCIAARKRYRLRPRSPLASAPSSAVPGVSILRPLKGLDTNLYENLECTFIQEYSNYEIFFCVDDEDDQALNVVRDLMSKYPNVNAHVAIRNGATVGVNPKVNNLMAAYNRAAYDILWVLDSNVMVDPDTLARSVDILNPPPTAPIPCRRIGVVHHVPYAWVTKHALGSRVEEAFLNTNHAKMYIAINVIAVDSCVVGKSCLYRKSDVERVDGSLRPIPNAENGGCQPGERGLGAFERFLAEDNMIASALWHELGLRHDLFCVVAKNAEASQSARNTTVEGLTWTEIPGLGWTLSDVTPWPWGGNELFSRQETVPACSSSSPLRLREVASRAHRNGSEYDFYLFNTFKQGGNVTITCTKISSRGEVRMQKFIDVSMRPPLLSVPIVFC